MHSLVKMEDAYRRPPDCMPRSLDFISLRLRLDSGLLPPQHLSPAPASWTGRSEPEPDAMRIARHALCDTFISGE